MLETVIGFPGTGKTTWCAMAAHKALKKGIKVYSNIPELTQTIPISVHDFGKFQLHNGLILFDEAGTQMHGRNWKAFPQEAINFFKLHRHYGCHIVILSQAKDFDVVVRNLCERQYIITKCLIPGFSKLRRCKPSWEEDAITGEIRAVWHFVDWLQGGVKYLYRPRWYKYFNSWAAPKLPDLPAEVSRLQGEEGAQT